MKPTPVDKRGQDHPWHMAGEKKIKCVGKYVEKLEPTYIADGNVKYYSHHVIQFIGFLKEFN